MRQEDEGRIKCLLCKNAGEGEDEEKSATFIKQPEEIVYQREYMCCMCRLYLCVRGNDSVIPTLK